MCQIIVIGHGGYAKGIKSNIQMLFGEPSHMHYLDFYPNDSLQGLEIKLNQLLGNIDKDTVIFCCDILGGSPFRLVAVLTAQNPKRYVTVCGINTMAYLELAMDANSDYLDLAKRAIQTTKQSVSIYPE